MFLKRIALLGVILGAGLGTAACTDGYGYSGVGVGYGAGLYDGGYGYADPYYGGLGYGAGSSYFGWYGDYYYPGTGIYVYDRYRRPFRWNNGQRRYWEGRRNAWRGDRNFRNDWNGFDRSNPQWRGNDGQWRGDRTPGVRGDGVRGDRTPGYRGNRERGDRGTWRGRRNDAGQPGVTPPAATPQRAPNGGQRTWGGNLGGGQRTWGGNRGGGNRGWGGNRGGGGQRDGGNRTQR